VSTTKVARQPGPDHPITIEHSKHRVIVNAAGRIVADTHNALVLKEANYPAVHYIPRKDVDMAQLVRTDHATYCPYKGDCSYYSIRTGNNLIENAVWSYEHPHEAVASIKNYLAFYLDRIDALELLER
jgi:uncharacterized protein (DUF427 family)